MALAAVKTWNPGDTLTAADLNALNTNILNNPISLVSPTTGAINFQTSVAHTNLQVSALTASSGFAGSVLVTSTAATPVPLWSTGATAGGVFVASTGAIPTWSAAAPAGGAFIASSSGAPQWTAASVGGVLIASTVSLPNWLAIGTSGSFLVAATSGAPAWRVGGSAIIPFNTGTNTVNTTAVTGVGPSGAASQTAYLAPFAGIAKGFTVTADAAPSAGQTFTYTLRKNIVNQAITVTVTTSASPSGTGSDTTNTVTYAALDQMDVILVLSSVGTNTAHRVLVGYGQTS